MVRPKRLRKPRKSTPTPTGKINLHTLLSLEEDQALAGVLGTHEVADGIRLGDHDQVPPLAFLASRAATAA